MMKRKISIVDTTLRDGQQTPGLTFSLKMKESLAMQLDRSGVSKIELFSPNMSSFEAETLKVVGAIIKNAQLVVWNRLMLKDIEATLNVFKGIVHICFPITDRQLHQKLKLNLLKACLILKKGALLIKESGSQVSIGLEDVSRAEKTRLDWVMDYLEGIGVKYVRLSDTVGVLTPGRTLLLVELFKTRGFTVEFHAHNDLGLANANSLIAAQYGADYVDTTLAGIGERAGNASLYGFVQMAESSPFLSLDINSQQAMSLEEEYRPYFVREEFLKSLVSSKASDITFLGDSCQTM
ncbi:MAG: homocitrate synthase [Deltaproteobacteria bacterium]|nr:homocitrate synthase [Deltaproteobacteria bacterium]